MPYSMVRDFMVMFAISKEEAGDANDKKSRIFGYRINVTMKRLRQQFCKGKR